MTEIKPHITLNYFMVNPKYNLLRLILFSFLIFAFLVSCGNSNKKTLVFDASVIITNPPTKKDSILNTPIDILRIVVKKEDVIKNPNLYIKPKSTLPEFTALHKSAIKFISEFEFAKEYIKCDADFRSLCSQGFAKAFYEANM